MTTLRPGPHGVNTRFQGGSDTDEHLRHAGQALRDLTDQKEALQTAHELLMVEHQALNTRHTKALQDLGELRDQLEVFGRVADVLCVEQALLTRK